MIKLTAILPARNESWIIGMSMRAALMWADDLVVLDHCSTDNTRQILDDIATENPGRVKVLSDDDPIWHEMALRQRLLETARNNGATHLIIIDADEVLTGNLLPVIRSLISTTTSGNCGELPMYCLWRNLQTYRTDRSSPWGRMSASTWFADAPHLHWQARAGGYDFHHRAPMGWNGEVYRPIQPGGGGLMHLQFANWRRLRAKQALYKMVEMTRWPWQEKAVVNARYDPAVDETGLLTMAVPGSWWAPYEHLMQYIDLEQTPWQEAACRKFQQENKPELFMGLNLFGVLS
jgi:glycosyltransferase involved in cell wall biosynthesis